MHSSPFGVIPKSEVGKWRLIIDLSAPIGSSMNDDINKDLYSLTYLSINSVAENVAQYGVGCLLAKFDLNAAYRNIPVHPDDRHLLGLQWDNSLYIETCLLFGLRSAPMIFMAVAYALAFIIGLRIKSWLDHYLDDFVILGPADSDQCQHHLLAGLEVCSKLGFPVVEEKTFGPATTLTLLGIETDSVVGELRLPLDKLTKLRLLVAKWRSRKACTKRELQSLADHLNHACKVVKPGRRFLRGIFRLISQFRCRNHMAEHGFLRRFGMVACLSVTLEWSLLAEGSSLASGYGSHLE